TPGTPAGQAAARETHSYSYGQTLTQLTQIGIPAVHDSGYIGTGVLVAVLDDGFNFHHDHEALRGQIIPPGFQRDFVDGDTTVEDTTQTGALHHGSWTFGLLGANKFGTYVGGAFGATFALARTENDASEHVVEMVNWANAAEWADSLGADLIS